MSSRALEGDALPAVVGHRGASATHPENTLEAFEAAIAAGAQAVELDIRLSADGVPIVFHDLNTSRVTGRAGMVNELTLEEIRALDASGARGIGVRVPSFREVLLALTGRVGIIVEIKNRPGEPTYDSPKEAGLAATLEELGGSGFDGPVLVVSFNPPSIERCRRWAPQIQSGFLVPPGVPLDEAIRYCEGEGHVWVLPRADEVLAAGRAFVEEAHGARLRAATWTVDDPETATELFSWDIDAVATNDPAAIVPVRPRRPGPAGS